MTTSTETLNEAVYRRLHDATNTRDIGVISRTADDVLHPDAVFHAAGSQPAPAAQFVKGAWAMLLRAFPDIQVTIEDVIADGDKIVVRNVVTGTHEGDYRGLPATGRTIAYDEMFVARFADDKIAEIWAVVDVFSQLQQLGALPRT